MKTLHRVAMRACACLPLVALLAGCGSSQQNTATAEEVRDGEALPPAPPVPAQPLAAGSPSAPVVRDAGPAQAPAAAPTPAAEVLTEAQIARVSELVNTAEIDQGKVAQTRAKASGVKKFAAMMVQHHGEALRQQALLVKQLKLTTADSAAAAKLKADAAETLETLRGSDAAGFDAVYVRSQVDGHQKVLQLIDTQLLPGAKTPEVLEALRRARVVVENHLSEARALQAK